MIFVFMPQIDPELVVAHLEYSGWAAEKTLAFRRLSRLAAPAAHGQAHNASPWGQLVTLVRQAGYEPTQADWTDRILFYMQRFPLEQSTAASSVA